MTVLDHWSVSVTIFSKIIFSADFVLFGPTHCVAGRTGSPSFPTALALRALSKLIKRRPPKLSSNIRQLNLQRAKTLFFLSKKIKKNFCFAIPVCIRTEFNLRNHKKQLHTPISTTIYFTCRVFKNFKEDLTFNVETKN